MKIGILTQPLHNNYGGLLQNYALQQVLKRMGHEVDTLDWNVDSSSCRRVLSWCKWYLFCLFDKKTAKPKYKLTDEENSVISRYNQDFIDRYLSVCPTKANKGSDYVSIASDYAYDVYVVGSDQVWRPIYNPLQSAMFLDFCEKKKVKRIAYAASFGTSEWEFSPKQTKQYTALVKKFDMITVREDSGVELCRKYFGVNVQHVLDPTMLLNKEDYIKLVENEKEPQSKGDLFYYILDPSDEKKTLIKDIAAKNGLTPFTVMPKYQAENRTKEDVKKRIEDCIFPSVTSWLRAFMDAEMVIVDSFHGAVFSIIFNKPFWVIGNSKRGNARFESLLGLYGLEDRMITPGDSVDWGKTIDWKRVNKIREREKVRSLKTFEVLSK